jgi:oligoendopeptidase F
LSSLFYSIRLQFDFNSGPDGERFMSEKTVLDFQSLPCCRERCFLPVDADCGRLETVKDCQQRLLAEDIASVEQLEAWVSKRSEFNAAFDQAGTILYIQMTCQTDDKQKAGAYQNFVENVVPAAEPLEDRLNRKFLADNRKFPLDQDRYGLYIRSIQVGVELYRAENIPLSTQVSILSQEYQALTGAMTVLFEGQERTMPQMGKFLQEPDRALREKAWRAITRRRLADKDKLEGLFDKMRRLRHRIAVNAGFANFMEYKFKSLCRFDYTPEDCRQYHRSVEELVVPLWGSILWRRKNELGVDALRPWDLSVDPLGRPALRPFDNIKELIAGCERIFSKIDPALGGEFSAMARQGALDLESRKGKAPGGYQSALAEARRPFIFMNAVGVDSDVWTLLHEGGHAFHVNAVVDLPLYEYRHAPMEFCEVASMAMEMLGMDHLDEFYNNEDLARSKRAHLEGLVWTLQWVAAVDAFQQWIYLHPEHSPDERRIEWGRIRRRFDGEVVDWSGLEEEFACSWHQQLHIFEVPFYYIEYGIAQLGALQLWKNSRRDLAGAVASYRSALALGGSEPLPRLYGQAGIRFDFSRQTIAPLVELVQAELEKMEKI